MAALNTLLLLLAALAIPGLINRTRALLAGRKGIRFAQHLYDVRLLLRKGAVYSPTTTAVFRAAPSVTLGTALVAALFVPVGDLRPVLSFDGDLVAFTYLLALGRVKTAIWSPSPTSWPWAAWPSSSRRWTPEVRSRAWAPAAKPCTARWSNRR